MVMNSWKPSRLFPEYEVSNDGRVRRLTRGGRRYPVGYELKPKPHQKGYLYFILRSGDKDKTVLAHRLVALEWIGEPPSPSHEVAHNNGDKRNNHVNNLRWALPVENQADRKRHGTYVAGEDAYSAKLSDDEAEAIRTMYAAKGRKYVGGEVVMQDLANQFGVSLSQVSRIVNGKQRAQAAS